MISIYRKFFDFSKKQRKRFNRTIILSIIQAFFEALRIPAIAVVLKALLEESMSYNTVFVSFSIMVVSIIGCSLSRNFMTMQTTIGSHITCSNKRIEIGEHLKYMPMGYFNNNSLGYITSVTTNTIEALQDSITNVIQMSLQGLITTVILALSVCIFDIRIGLIMILGILMFLFVNSLLQKKSLELAPKKSYEDSRLVESILEYIKGISVVKTFNLDKNANHKIKKVIEDNQKINFDLEKNFIPFMGLQTMVLKVFGAIITFVSIYFYTTDSMSIINTILMIICSYIIYSQLESAGSYSSLLRLVDASIDKINEIFDTPIMDLNGENILSNHYNIEAENIVFSYENRRIIDGISFKIPQKTTTAIVGPSGSGKSTICNLIARFWDIDSGKIKIGGRDIREYTLDSLLSNISMVFQDIYLFHDTVENNIKFGKPDATRKEVIEIAKKACCHEFIMQLPNGYDTIIGESGGSISGGEKQRISIARALIKDSPIIILDEATSNVDPENEKELQKAIEELTRNKTVIMIAHRLKTIKNADQILVLDKGKVVQKGKHNELIKEKGVYKDFINVREKSIGWKIK